MYIGNKHVLIRVHEAVWQGARMVQRLFARSAYGEFQWWRSDDRRRTLALAIRSSSRHIASAATGCDRGGRWPDRSEEHTSELQSLMRTSYAVFCSKKKITKNTQTK